MVNGEWWIEDRTDLPKGAYEPPENTVAGTLDDSGTDGWSLETIGGISGHLLYDRLGSDAPMPVGPATIWGVNTDQQSFSLFSCYTAQTKLVIPSLRGGTERWRIGAIASGRGIWVKPETPVDEITVEYRDLAAWAWHRHELGVEPDFTEDGVILSVSLVRNFLDAHVQGCPVTLSWRRKAEITQGPFDVGLTAAFTIADKITIAEIAEKWVFPLGQLLSLLTLSRCNVISVEVRVAEGEADGAGKTVNLRFPQASDHNREGEEDQDPLGRQLDMLATRTFLEERGVDLTALLNAYFDFKSNRKLSDALEHFLESQAITGTGDVDEALRRLFNSFENLHTALFPGTVEDSQELADAIKELVSNSPAKHRDELAHRLGQNKSKSIKQKLQDLVDICGEATSRVLAMHPDLVTDARDARNEIAHANPSSASRWERVGVLVDLQWLIRHALLQQLGVLPSGCDDIFRQVGHPFNQYVGHQ